MVCLGPGFQHVYLLLAPWLYYHFPGTAQLTYPEYVSTVLWTAQSGTVASARWLK
jgi:hypothetical protein